MRMIFRAHNSDFTLVCGLVDQLSTRRTSFGIYAHLSFHSNRARKSAGLGTRSKWTRHSCSSARITSVGFSHRKWRKLEFLVGFVAKLQTHLSCTLQTAPHQLCLMQSKKIFIRRRELSAIYGGAIQIYNQLGIYMLRSTIVTTSWTQWTPACTLNILRECGGH